MQITRGKLQTAQKVVIYGPEGIGKSTFAAQFPNALFIDTEGSTKQMDVARLPKPTSWAMLMEEIETVKADPSICKTLVIDTTDWAEQLCITAICSKAGKSGIEDFGYGNGYVYEKEEFGRMLNRLEEIVEHGVNIVLTAHAQLRKFEQPDEAGAYDRWELKLGKKTTSLISPLIKEWADMVLFANYKTFSVSTDDKGKKFKAQGGTRVMYTTHHPCWDAKNRHGLPLELPFDYKEIAHCIPGTVATPPPGTPAAPSPQVSKPVKVEDVQTISEKQAPSEIKSETAPNAPIQIEIPESVPKALRDLMMANKVSCEDIQTVVGQKGYFPADMAVSDYPAEFVEGCLIAAWPAVMKMVMSNKDLPF